ncbi:hypothetical protein KH172YL63_17820 [Bacillus sp. KH172YL63]|nr:hypothetical protein KH172YL63_17820 [Bacillus sp. KH172YL63]
MALLFFSPSIVMMAVFLLFFIQAHYHTTPASLDLKVDRNENKVVMNGTWVEDLERYRFPTDFIVFYVNGDRKVTDVKRNRSPLQDEMDWELLEDDVKKAVATKKFSHREPQVFDIFPEETFTLSFHLPDGTETEDLDVYYVHIREEPMEEMAYWFKKVDLKEQEGFLVESS